MKRFFFAVSSVFPVLFFGAISCGIAAAQSPNLGPGVLTTVQPDIQYDETYTREAATDLLKNEPALDETLAGNVLFDRKQWADDIRFSRDIWCLEFQYKPIRTIKVDVPTKNGIESKLVLYMVYAVTNTGKNSAVRTTIDKPYVFPEQTEMVVNNCTCAFCQEAGIKEGSKTIEVNAVPVLKNQPGTYKPEPMEMPIQFTPRFQLASNTILENAASQVDPQTGDITILDERATAVFSDQVIPIAIDAISKREKAEKPFESTVSIAGKTIKPNETVWGVVTWVDVDPRINTFVVLVRGLTNAYKLDEESGFPRPKTLQLNFSRPGDEFEMTDRQFRIGIRNEEGVLVDKEWFYPYYR